MRPHDPVDGPLVSRDTLMRIELEHLSLVDITLNTEWGTFGLNEEQVSLVLDSLARIDIRDPGDPSRLDTAVMRSYHTYIQQMREDMRSNGPWTFRSDLDGTQHLRKSGEPIADRDRRILIEHILPLMLDRGEASLLVEGQECREILKQTTAYGFITDSIFNGTVCTEYALPRGPLIWRVFVLVT